MMDLIRTSFIPLKQRRIDRSVVNKNNLASKIGKDLTQGFRPR